MMNELMEAIGSQMVAKMAKRFGVQKTTDLGNIHCLQMVLKLCVWVPYKSIAETLKTSAINVLDLVIDAVVTLSIRL